MQNGGFAEAAERKIPHRLRCGMEFSLSLFELVNQDIGEQKKERDAAEDEEHNWLLHAGIEEIHVAIHAVSQSVDHGIGRAECAKLLERAAHGVIAEQRRAVGSGEKGERLLQSLTKA